MAGAGDIEETGIQEFEVKEEQTAIIDGAEAGSSIGPATQNNLSTESSPWFVAISGRVTDNIACRSQETSPTVRQRTLVMH